MSLAEVGLALKSHLLAPRSEPAASVVNFVLRHSGLERGVYRKTFSPFRSRFAPQRLKYRSRWRQEGLNLARPKGRKRHLTSTFKKTGLEAWTFLVTWALNFVYSGRHGERAERPETSWNSEMDTKQFEQQSSQVLCLSANIHFTQKVEKYMQNGQLLQLKGDLQEQLSYLTSLQFDQDLQQVKLKALILDLIHNIAIMDDLFNHKVQRASDWHWFRQLQYYLKTNCAPDQKPAFVKMLECEQSYSFEYQGNASKLVHTHPDRQVLLDPHAWHAPGLRRKPLRSCWHRENRVCEGSRCVPRSASPRFQLRRGH